MNAGKYEIAGHLAYNILKNETGGLRFQRVSPTEKNGRIHTSTITIAVFEESGNNNLFQLNLEEFEESGMSPLEALKKSTAPEKPKEKNIISIDQKINADLKLPSEEKKKKKKTDDDDAQGTLDL